MNYLNIFLFTIFIILPKIALSDPSEIGAPDLSKSIFSGKFIPAPAESANPPAIRPTPNSGIFANNPATNSSVESSSNSPSQVPQFNFNMGSSITAPPQIPNLNHSSPAPAGAAGSNTNYGPPPKPVLTEGQKNIISEAKEEEQKMKKAFDKALTEKFDTYTYPQEYYPQPFSKQNSHLPPVNFASHYAELAFRYAKSDDYLNVRYFIKKYNFTDVIDENGNNLLMVAVTYGGIKTARMLLANQIFHINAQNKQNLRSPLHMAVMNNNYEMTRLLLTMGASTSIKDTADMTPLDYSLLLDNSLINSLLLAYK